MLQTYKITTWALDTFEIVSSAYTPKDWDNFMAGLKFILR